MNLPAEPGKGGLLMTISRDARTLASETPAPAGRQTFRSVPEMLLRRIAATPRREAFQHRVGDDWRALTWSDVGDSVRAIASGLRALGLNDEQRCSILSGTRLEWILCDLGILCAGGATTTIYPASTAEECAFILKDSGSAFVFAENEGQAAKLVAKRGELPQVQRVIVIDGPGGQDGWVMPLAELMGKGREHDARDPSGFERVAGGVGPDALATLIYTSGTTGRPKGVELTHDNWVYEAEAIDDLGLLLPEDKQFLWLPLAHSFGKVLEVAQLRIGFSTAVDGRVDKIVENLAVVKPTFVAAVPRIFEKVHNRVVSGAMEGGALKAKIFSWAVGVGRRCSELEQRGGRPGGLLALQRSIAHKLVFSKLQARFGGRLRFFVSGSAPLARPLAEFFHAAGVLILEGYGLTESSAASFVNRPNQFKFGTVGPPLPGTKVKLGEDGEILIGGRGIMRGYHGLPEETKEALDGRWLRTGDIGELDPQGFLSITDRKKDLIKTSGGKYVAPQYIEGELKALCPYLSQVLVHGDRRNFCSALITFDEEALKKWAADHGLSGSYAELAARPETRALIQSYVDQLNSRLPSYATIKKFAILSADLTVESGDLTTSLKLKRKAVEKKNKPILDSLYTSGT
jgi:long-chain acyl-CoA synthetase